MTTMTTVKYLLLSYIIKNNLNTIFFIRQKMETSFSLKLHELLGAISSSETP